MTTESIKAKKIAAAERELAKASDRHAKAFDKHLALLGDAERSREVADAYQRSIAKAQAHLDWVRAMPTSDGEDETEAIPNDPDTMAAPAEAEAEG